MNTIIHPEQRLVFLAWLRHKTSFFTPCYRYVPFAGIQVTNLNQWELPRGMQFRGNIARRFSGRFSQRWQRKFVRRYRSEWHSSVQLRLVQCRFPAVCHLSTAHPLFRKGNALYCRDDEVIKHFNKSHSREELESISPDKCILFGKRYTIVISDDDS